MADKLQAVRGMNDVMAPDIAKWHFLERRARARFESFGYREIRTPLVEYTPLFERGIGEVTDIVEKEMYTFPDRDGQRLTLRPEGTASAVRAYIEHAVFAREPVTRWYYAGPMFRHERAQRGRYRQFYQLGCEVFGVAEPTIDAEVIAMVTSLLLELELPCDVRVNSLGGPDDRPRYRAALVEYFHAREAELCPDCRRRLETNPLRILDCKNERCAGAAAGAPSILDHLGETSRAHFDGVCRALEQLAVPFKADPRMVRGFDYYTGAVFEIRSQAGELGAQNTLCGGGRYDNLVAELGGPATPALGFALGVERLLLAIPGAAETFDPGIDLFILTHGEAAQAYALALAHRLRLSGRRVELDHRKASFKSQMKRADKLKAKLAILIGDDELQAHAVTLRDMQTGTEAMVAEADLLAELARRIG
jgi:histidyl-tRNA synthetase